MIGPLKIVKVEVKAKTRKLAENWTCEIVEEVEHYYDSGLEDKLSEILGWNIQLAALKDMSWHTFTCEKWDTSAWAEMTIWAKEHCNSDYKVRQNVWVFEDEQDYIMFTLRWS